MSTLSTRIVQESVRTWALSEARDIEKGVAGTPSTITAADIYASQFTRQSPQALATAYADAMDGAMLASQERRWDHVLRVCEEWGVTL